MKTYPMLYKKASTGKDLQWRIWVDGSTIHEEWGQIGGKLQTTTDTIKAGKNIGRANATTAVEQAESEAQSKWEKKLKGHNYTESLSAAQKGEASDMVEGGVLPMLAHKFSEQGDKLKYPCFVQPKLDGHRCIGMPGGLWSRTRKPITSVPHIANRIKRETNKHEPYDGELYNADYRDKFEELSSFIRPKDPKPGHEVVQYHVYDLAHPTWTFRERTEWLAKQLADPSYEAEGIHLVETREVQNEDELMLAFEDFLAQGYEGAIARNADGLYVNKRSYDLLKMKKFDDAEFRITGVKEGRGKLAGHGIFECVTGDEAAFEAKMKGDTTKLKEYFEHPERFIGKMLTVQYFGMTAYGKPRFPVALRLREDV